MPTPTYPLTLQIAQHFSIGDSEEMVNVFYKVVDSLSGFDQAFATAFADSFHDAWDAHLKGRQHTSCILDYISVKDVSVENGARFDTFYETFGTNGSAPLPAGTAAVVSWRTAKTGRSFRGRTFLGGFTESNSDGYTFDATLTSAIKAWADDILDLELAIASPTLGETNQVVSYVLRPHWHSQRRRNPRN